jgi:deoxyribodipyrimidine photolyase
MHNRARMIAAMYLAKDLMIDWRLGERVSYLLNFNLKLLQTESFFAHYSTSCNNS